MRERSALEVQLRPTLLLIILSQGGKFFKISGLALGINSGGRDSVEAHKVWRSDDSDNRQS
jgi:hypothetical protein